MQRGENALGGVIEESGANTDLLFEFESVRRTEEGFVLSKWLALVVEDCPGGAHPAMINGCAAFGYWPGAGLNLFLNLAAEAVRVRETVLDLGRLPGFQIRNMRLAD